MRSRSYLWVALVLAIVLGALWQYVPLEDAKARMDSLPLKGIGYQGKEIRLTEFEKNIFKNVNVLKRSYTVGGHEFFVTVLDGTKDRHLVHDPYYCFAGTGWEIVTSKKMNTEKGNVEKLKLVRKKDSKEALFWFTDGGSHYSTPVYYWLQTAYRRLTFGASGSEPVLVIVQAERNQLIDWYDFKRNFSTLFEL